MAYIVMAHTATAYTVTAGLLAPQRPYIVMAYIVTAGLLAPQQLEPLALHLRPDQLEPLRLVVVPAANGHSLLRLQLLDLRFELVNRRLDPRHNYTGP